MKVPEAIEAVQRKLLWSETDLKAIRSRTAKTKLEAECAKADLLVIEEKVRALKKELEYLEALK